MDAVELLIGDAFSRAVASALKRVLHKQVVALLDVELRLRALHDFCDGCDCSRAKCDQYTREGAVACCPDCVHKWAVRP